MIIFENPGMLDDHALLLMGINAKPNSTNPIGFFGTGLKYALAIAARKGWPVIIQPGDGQSYPLEVEPMNFRGSEFTGLRYRSYTLPFTTELGKTWQSWMVYRELKSNALDEGGLAYEAYTIPKPEHNLVRLIFDTDDLTAYHNTPGAVFFDGLDFEQVSPTLQRSSTHAGRIYYRGIRVGETNSPAQFSYNILSSLRLTEDRTVGGWEIMTNIRHGYTFCPSMDIIQSIFHGGASFEEDLSWTYSTEEMNGTPAPFNRAVRDLADRQPERLPHGLLDSIRKAHKQPNHYNRRQLTASETEMIETATRFVAFFGFTNLPEVEWNVQFSEHRLGLSDGKKIYIGTEAFEQGLNRVCTTLLEECVHHYKGYNDGSRAMQNWLFDQLGRIGLEFIKADES